jgi:hypothetical protein
MQDEERSMIKNQITSLEDLTGSKVTILVIEDNQITSLDGLA